MKTPHYKKSVSRAVIYAADALGVRTTRHDALLSLLSDGVAENDMDGRIVYVNPAWCKLFQRRFDRKEAPFVWDFVEGHEERLAARRYFTESCNDHADPAPYEARLVRGDGTVFDAAVSWSYCRDERGRLTGMVSVIKDISVLRNSEREAVAREQLSRAVFDSMFQFTFVLSPEGVLLDANRGAGTLMRMPVDRATGRFLCELPPWSGSGPSCDTLRMGISNARQGAFQRFESQFAGRDKGLVYIDFSLKPVRDAEGQVLLLLLEGRDVSERAQSEAASQAEREQFRNIIESGQAGFVIVDVEGNIQYMNGHARKIFGSEVELVEARNALSPDWKVTGEKSTEENLFVRMVGTGQPMTEREVEISLPGGRRLLLSIRGTPMREIDGRVSMVVFSFEDITERQAASKALQASEARLRAIYNSAFDALVTIDAKGFMLGMNPAAEEVFGYKVEELHHKNISMLMPSPFAERHDDYLAAYMAGGGQNVIGKVRELTGLRKGGETFPMELTVSEGRLNGERIFTGVVRDLSEKKRAEEVQRRLLNILEASPDLIAMTNQDGDIVHLNRAGRRFLGASPSAQFPMDAVAAHAPWARKRLVEEAIPAAIANGVWSGKSALLSPDRGEIPVLESLLAHDEAGGGNTYFSMVCRDISQLKRIENVKDALISTVSHELRSPLTSLHGSLRLLVGGLAGEVDDEARSVLHLALKSTNRLNDLISNFLYLDAVESGRVDMKCQSMDVAAAVNEAVQAATALSESATRHMEFRWNGSRVLALAHPGHLAEVMAHILSNAVKFSGPGSPVDVALIENENTVRIEIADRGPGITRQFGNQVFQKFARADSTDGRETEGTGLGLSVAWALVVGMGGDIGFLAREGGGTIFWVELKR